MCCHSSGSAPSATLKKLASKRRSKVSRNSATEMTGSEKSSSTWGTSDIQVNTGIFMSVMPGARMLSTVVNRWTDPTSEATPVSGKPKGEKTRQGQGEKGKG